MKRPQRERGDTSHRQPNLMAYTFGITPAQLHDGRVMYCIKEYLRHTLERETKGQPWRVQRLRHSGVIILQFKWEVPEHDTLQ